MGIMKEIIDTARDIANVGAGSMDDIFKKKKHGSLSRRSLEGTLQFPVLVTKSLDIETLQMITKALERQYASFAQVALTMNPMLDLQKDRDAVGYLRKFHQNSNTKVGWSDINNLGVDVLEGYNVFSDESEKVYVFAGVHEGSTATIIAANKQQLQNVLEGVREDVLNEKFIPRNTQYRFNNENLTRYHNSIVTEDQTFTGNIASINVQGGGKSSYGEKDPDFVIPNNILQNNEAKKANELVPTTMHVRTVLMNKEGENQGHMDFIVGIKATMHPIASDEMVTNVLSAVKNKGKIFNSIRWTTGEISFFKDFLFNIKEIKNDVANRSLGSSPWWIALKRRKSLAKIKGALMMPNQILPNASIVLSMEEVEYIKSEYGYDLMNPSFVDKIMATYFLLGFVVVDNSTQIAHFLFDGQQDYQSVSFNGLESEAKRGGSSDIKDVLKLIQRI